MKQILSLILAFLLCLVMTVGLLGCAPEEAESALQVGFGRADITPEFSVPLAGYPGSQNRFSINVLDPLYATCIAFTDAEGNTVLLYTLDLCNLGGTAISFARKEISEVTGLPIENIMASSTHTHSAPVYNTQEPAILKNYQDYVEEQMVAAAQEALADRKSAEMYTTSTNIKNMNFVRHYRMDDGSVVGDNFGDETGKTFVKHVKDADDEMQLIRFKREGGKDVVLVNWQAHPLRTGGATAGDVSADIVGSMRMAMETQADCLMAYFTGASGNIDPTSRIASENITSDYLEQGQIMAQRAILACDSMVKQETGRVQILRRDQTPTIKGNENNLMTFAFSIGDVAFIASPNEMFDTNGRFIKENSPFEMTFIVTMANGSSGYIAAEWAYEYGGYEVELVGYDKGEAEKVADGFVEMLTELYPTRK